MGVSRLRTLVELVNKDAYLCGIKIDSAEEIPKLIDALEAFGRFESAECYRDILADIKYCIHGEFTLDRPTTVI